MKKSVGINSTGARGAELQSEFTLRSRELALNAMGNPTQDDAGFDGNPQPDFNSPEELAKAELEFHNEEYRNH